MIEELRKCKKCGVCKQPETHRNQWGVVSLAVDHDHSCCPGYGSCGACVRGLLCGRCNRSIGLMGDDPQRILMLASYLTDWPRSNTYRFKPHTEVA